jgi:tRNA-2-methylthio-N6-dimethylallyladenosine synthase
MNVSDSERVSTLLRSEGFEMTAEEESADVVIFNTCSVREKAEHKLYTRVGQVRKSEGPRKMVGVMGCVAQLEGENLFEGGRGIDFVVGTRAVGRVATAIERVSVGNAKVLDLKGREDDYDWTVAETQRHSPYVAFVPIIEGCNKFCTYCIVPFSRGREKSLAPAEIIRQVLELRRQGVREIHLIGQNVNSYRPLDDSGMEKFKGATPFSRLLRAVAATGVERIKFATSFPRDFHNDIVEAINEHENLCNWVHLPVQSGSDRILRAMRRGHTVENYRKRIDLLKASPRIIALSTDIIVGFPGETEDDHRQTMDLVRYCQYDSAYIFKYSPRPGTPAAEMEDDVSKEVKTRRFIELETIQKENQARSLGSALGTTLDVLAEKISGRDKLHLSGHTSCHKVVNFEGTPHLLGEICKVRITQVKSNTLFGESV